MEVYVFAVFFSFCVVVGLLVFSLLWLFFGLFLVSFLFFLVWFVFGFSFCEKRSR